MDEKERSVFIQGVIEGMQLFAWWKDGTQWVGNCGTTFKEAKQNVLNGKYDKLLLLED